MTGGVVTSTPLQQRRSGGSTTCSRSTHQPQPAPKAPAVTDSGIEPKLIGVVVKYTGYPEDFIEMDQDLEGELGIDTVTSGNHGRCARNIPATCR